MPLQCFEGVTKTQCIYKFKVVSSFYSQMYLLVFCTTSGDLIQYIVSKSFGLFLRCFICRACLVSMNFGCMEKI